MEPLLTGDDEAMLDGEQGAGRQLAMRIVVAMAQAMAADRLIDIEGAHIDSCLFHGRAGLDFAQRLVAGAAKVRVPTTLNVSSLDLLHPELLDTDADTTRQSRELMELYEAMGCRPTWTCAPYDHEARPRLGSHVAWAESNAIVFANSVLGARTHRYGDFLDICAAVTGRVPAAGLHLDSNRHATEVVEIAGISSALIERDVAYPVIGHAIGRLVHGAVPAIVGLPAAVPEHRLKALGAAAASSGSVAMFHAVGSTPEAPTLDAALGDRRPVRHHRIDAAAMRAARDELSTSHDSQLQAVSVGTPHYGIAELGRLVELMAGRRIDPGVKLYVSTGRAVHTEAALRGWIERLEDAGITVVTDTCTYITPILGSEVRVALTDSAKWAYYAPGNLGIDVVFASIEECVESAVAGRIVRDPKLWGDD